MFNKLKACMRKFGPGFITGASDDDPSGIATYSQAGAQFGLSMLWVALFSFPLMAAVQEISARIGRVTGHGLAGNIRKHYPPVLLYLVVLLVAISNIINIGADVGAMGASLELVAGRDRWHLYPVLIGAGSVVALTFLSYQTYSSVLKWLGLFVFSYVAVALFLHVPWKETLHGLLIPHVYFNRDYLTILTAVFGTTISPYLFVWQSSLEVEQQRSEPGEKPLLQAPRQARRQFSDIRIDTYSGMAISNVVTFFIILTTALTLHAHHATQIDSAQQAASALQPLAGRFAFLLFCMGIIGTGLLAIPTLAGSIGYAAGEAFGWPTGLDHKPYQAIRFYVIIALATAIGTVLNFIGVNPIRALIWSAVINGLISVPLLVALLLIGRNRTIMREFVIPQPLLWAGWITTLFMALAAVFTIVNLFLPGAQ